MKKIEKHNEQVKQAHGITNRNAIYAAGAGLIPVPFVDTAVLLTIQLSMINKHAKLYEVEFKEHIAKSLIGVLMGSISSTSLIKVIPGLGTVLGSLTSSIAGAASTYALGRVFTHHFHLGGTLLDFDPVASREFFRKEYEEGRLLVEEQNITDEPSDTNKSLKEQLLKDNEELRANIKILQQDIDALKLEQTETESEQTETESEQTETNEIADFTIIEGIGKKLDEVLKNAGIGSLNELSNTKVSRLKRILKDAGGKFNFADPTSWPQQADLAAQGKEEALQALQEQLIGGRIKEKSKK